MLPGETDGLRRALRMRLLAAQLISGYGREQVLEWYLNEGNFGHYAFGAGAAARLYLEQDASNLDLAEASLIIAILDAPALNPLDAPTAALERQGNVLLTLFQSGVLSEAEYQEASTQKLEIRHQLVEKDQVARAFTRQALEELSDRLGQERLERGGLTIRTTLDFDLQVQLVCTLKAQLLRLESGDLSSPVPEDCSSARLLPTLNLPQAPVGSDWSGSAALLDPQTGQLLALVGDSTSEGESAATRSLPGWHVAQPAGSRWFVCRWVQSGQPDLGYPCQSAADLN